jgi:bifunctional DNase/RNase
MEVEMKIRGLMMDPVTNMPIVILKDTSGDAGLPIWVGNLRSQRHRSRN